jgi:hypothetical protein
MLPPGCVESLGTHEVLHHLSTVAPINRIKELLSGAFDSSEGARRDLKIAIRFSRDARIFLANFYLKTERNRA